MSSIKIRRKINSTLLRIKELAKYKGKDVELNISIKEKIPVQSNAGLKNLSGVFASYANSNLRKNENQAWILAVKEKHEDYRR